MFLISHRGNISGKIIEAENNPEYIINALTLGYEVEIDVWFIDGDYYLGHDESQYKINYKFLLNNKLWCHAKNVEALIEMEKHKIHYFWHENDTVTLTSKNFIWAYPNKIAIKDSIIVLPEIFNTKIENCKGICSDYINNYK